MCEPTDDAPQDPGPVVDHWMQGQSASGRRRAGRGRRALLWAGCAFLFLIGVAGLAYTPQAWQQGDAMLVAGVCTPAQTAAATTTGCFVEVSGHIDARFSRGEWRFVPDDASRRAGYVHFADDNPYAPSSWPPDLVRLLGGEATTALYWGRDPVAFVVDGRRVETSSYGSSSVMVDLWGGVMGLSFGVVTLLRLHGRPAGRGDLALVASGIAALLCLGIDVLVEPPWPVEIAVWGVLVAATLSAPRRWVGAYAERAARRPLGSEAEAPLR